MYEPINRAGLLALCLLATGFDWPTSNARHQREMQRSSPTQKQDWLPRLAEATSAETAELLLRTLEDKNPAIRAAAAAELSGEPLALAVPILIDLTRQDSVAVQIAATRALGRSTQAERCVPHLLPLLTSGNPDLRAAASTALGALALPRSVPALLAQLGDEALSVRIAVAKALKAFPAKAVASPLQDLLPSAPTGLQRAIVETLAELHVANAVPAIALAASGNNDETSISAVLALGRIGGDLAEAHLHNLLAERSIRVVKATLTTLASFPTAKTSALLAAYLHHPQAGDHAERAFRHAVRFASASRDSSLTQMLRNALLTQVRGATSKAGGLPQLGIRTARLLASLPREEMRPGDVSFLLKLHTTAPSPATLGAVAATNSPLALPALMAAASAQDVSMRRAGRKGLFRFLDKHAVEADIPERLTSQLSVSTASDEQVDLINLVTLTKRPDVLPGLFPFLDSPHRAVAQAAVRAIGQLGPDAACSRLTALLAHPILSIQRAASEALGQCAGPLTLATLIPWLKSGHPARVRILNAIANAIRRHVIPIPDQLDAELRKHLQDLAFGSNEGQAIAAIHTLAEMPAEFSLPVLGNVLRQPTDRRRAEAAAALGRFPAHAARPLLRYLLRQASPTIMLGALSGIAEVGDERDLASVLKLSSSKRWPLPSMVPYVLSRWLARDVIPQRTAQRALCDLVDRADPTMQANAAAALAHTGAGDCPKQGISPVDFLSLGRSTAERVAGAHWLQSAIKHGRMPATKAQSLLLKCVQQDPSQQVREACTSPDSKQRQTTFPVNVTANDGSALAKRRVAIHLGDGTRLIALTDGLGNVYVPPTVQNAKRVTDPGLRPHRLH